MKITIDLNDNEAAMLFFLVTGFLTGYGTDPTNPDVQDCKRACEKVHAALEPFGFAQPTQEVLNAAMVGADAEAASRHQRRKGDA